MRKKKIRERDASRHTKKEKQSVCPTCLSPVCGGFAYLCCGAVIDATLLENAKLSDTAMEAFCNLGYHGVDSNMTDSVDYCVADGVKGGQLDIHFCSIECLEKWLLRILDDLKKDSGRVSPGDRSPGAP